MDARIAVNDIQKNEKSICLTTLKFIQILTKQTLQQFYYFENICKQNKLKLLHWLKENLRFCAVSIDAQPVTNESILET